MLFRHHFPKLSDVLTTFLKIKCAPLTFFPVLHQIYFPPLLKQFPRPQYFSAKKNKNYNLKLNSHSQLSPTSDSLHLDSLSPWLSLTSNLSGRSKDSRQLSSLRSSHLHGSQSLRNSQSPKLRLSTEARAQASLSVHKFRVKARSIFSL